MCALRRLWHSRWMPATAVGCGTRPAADAYTESIPEAAARLLLSRRFYRFAELDWLDLATGVQLARETGRPLHLIALFGTLDDESC